MAKVGETWLKRPGQTVAEAKQAMISAGEAPAGLAGGNTPVSRAATAVLEPPVPALVVPPVVTEEFEEEIEATPATPVAQPAPAPAPPAPVVAPPKVERVETSQFVGELKKENDKWVAELVYKNGAGTERFEARSKNELMLKLLEGKGHATLRVNKAVRREKLGWSELDRQYPLPDGITAKDFEEMNDKSQDALLRSIAVEQIVMFNEAHPEYYKDPEGKNAKKINDFLTEQHLPITLRNLEYALDELTDSNLPADVRLVERPVAVARVTPTISAPEPAPTRMDSVPAPAAPAPVPTAAAPTAPAVTVRKRGTTGLQPGDSSSPIEPGTTPEDGNRPRELSEAELRKLPMDQLKRIANADRRARAGQR